MEIEKKLDKALKQEVNFQLPKGFSDRVIQKIQDRPTSDRGLYWILAFSVAPLTLFALIGLIRLGMMETLLPMGKYVGWAIVLVLLVSIIQYFDRKLVKNKYRVAQL